MCSKHKSADAIIYTGSLPARPAFCSPTHARLSHIITHPPRLVSTAISKCQKRCRLLFTIHVIGLVVCSGLYGRFQESEHLSKDELLLFRVFFASIFSRLVTQSQVSNIITSPTVNVLVCVKVCVHIFF